MKINYSTKSFDIFTQFKAGEINIDINDQKEYNQLIDLLYKRKIYYIVGEKQEYAYSPNYNLGFLPDHQLHEWKKTHTSLTDRLIDVTKLGEKERCGWSQTIKNRPIVSAQLLIKELL